MQNYPLPQRKEKYDPRWFVWTIVFLVVVGISLVSYITLSEQGESEYSPMVTTHLHTAK